MDSTAKGNGLLQYNNIFFAALTVVSFNFASILYASGPISSDSASDDPTAAQIEALLTATHREGTQLGRAYHLRGYTPIWTAGGGEAAWMLRDLVRDLPSDALPAMPDAVFVLDRFLSADPDIWKTASVDLRMTEIFLEYARRARHGVIVPLEVSEEIKVTPPTLDDFDILLPLAEAVDTVSYLQQLGPVPREYAALRKAFAEISRQVAQGGWGDDIIPDGPLIPPMTYDYRIPLIQARLMRMGDLQSVPDNNVLVSTLIPASLLDNIANFYRQELVQAVMQFQARHGLKTDGLIGDATLAAMNVTAEERLRQLAVNLERLRWRDGERERNHIFVNLPDYNTQVFVKGRMVFQTRSVIGTVGKYQTPEFSHKMTFLVANPTWTVPKEIAVQELLPELQQNPDFLDENNMSLIRAGITPIPDDVSTIDWFSFSEEFFPYWLRQSPGPWNALGRMKFMFPNDDNIYLHDTPSRGLFQNDIRDGSHGCVRVEDPIAMARVLLAPNYPDGDVVEQLDAILASGVPTELPLRRMMPIHIDYRTAWVDADGILQFRQDVYGRDAAVFSAMTQKGVVLQ